MVVNRFPLWCKNGQYLSSGIPLFPSVKNLQAGIFPQILDLSLLTILSAIRHFFAMDESQARGPSARVRLSKIAGLM